MTSVMVTTEWSLPRLHYMVLCGPTLLWSYMPIVLPRKLWQLQWTTALAPAAMVVYNPGHKLQGSHCYIGYIALHSLVTFSWCKIGMQELKLRWCCIENKGEHECTRGWPGSVPVGLHTFKIETQTCVSNKVQVTQICRSSTCENTSTCHLIKKKWHQQDLNQQPLTFKTSDALDHWAICT